MNEKHISSIIIHTQPEHTDRVVRLIASFPHIDIYPTESQQGKVVAVMETETSRAINNTIQVINHTPNVLSVSMIYHQVESTQSLNEALA
ncbi:MAG: chaperone NapD [Cellvibrionaceae bacterium]